ncbi:hypothetical protein BDV95DRAFT_645440 [Massariosphaeria phaeospora]|uniref:Oxidoreductase n=1 Tax=Massariosphaeria phaeospora TaxID=100035 RepID=A0A7C8M4I4_9PLEO|nr:hypothetical protein BDV95DRAFT_645440 [Massariosphaeria phaeospora]
MVLKTDYDPAKDIPDLASKVIVITGGTAGSGKQTILTLSKHAPSHLLFTGRNTKAANEVIDEAQALSPSTIFSFIPCDHWPVFPHINSSRCERDTLQNRAHRRPNLQRRHHGRTTGLSKDGYEIQFAINFLAHALLIRILLPALEETFATEADARIVLLDLKTPQENLDLGSKWLRYAQSKLAMMLYAKLLAKRYPNFASIAIHPGIALTGLVEDQLFGDRLWLKTATFGQNIPVQEGVYNACWAATARIGKDQRVAGGMFQPVGIRTRDTKFSSDEELAERLWEWTEEQLESYK